MFDEGSLNVFFQQWKKPLSLPQTSRDSSLRLARGVRYNRVPTSRIASKDNFAIGLTYQSHFVGPLLAILEDD